MPGKRKVPDPPPDRDQIVVRWIEMQEDSPEQAVTPDNVVEMPVDFGERKRRLEKSRD